MNQPTTGEFCWNELATKDVHKAKDFYSKVLGWQFKDIKTDEMTYTIVTENNKDIAGIWTIPTELQSKVPAHWAAYILVSNVEETLAKAVQHGAQEVKEVTQVGDMGRFAIIIDPTGAQLAFWEPIKH